MIVYVFLFKKRTIEEKKGRLHFLSFFSKIELHQCKKKGFGHAHPDLR